MLLNAPLMTISILVFFVTYLGSIVLLFSIYILSKFQGETWTKEQSLVGFGSSILFLFVIGSLTWIYVMILLTATREESPNLITYFVTLIPLIFSIIVGYKAKEKLFKYKTTGNNKEEHCGTATENNAGKQTEEHVASTRFLGTEV